MLEPKWVKWPCHWGHDCAIKSHFNVKTKSENLFIHPHCSSTFLYSYFFRFFFFWDERAPNDQHDSWSHGPLECYRTYGNDNAIIFKYRLPSPVLRWGGWCLRTLQVLACAKAGCSQTDKRALANGRFLGASNVRLLCTRTRGPNVSETFQGTVKNLRRLIVFIFGVTVLRFIKKKKPSERFCDWLEILLSAF